jgi:hypothetical protein
MRVYFEEELSVEASYGKHAGAFLGADDGHRFGVGIDWHGLSALMAYSQEVRSPWNDVYRLSLNWGFTSPMPAHFIFFTRAGAYVAFHRSYASRSTSFGPNLDIGIGWRFF